MEDWISAQERLFCFWSIVKAIEEPVPVPVPFCMYSAVCIVTVWYWRLYQYQCRFVCTVPFVLLQYDIEKQILHTVAIEEPVPVPFCMHSTVCNVTVHCRLFVDATFINREKWKNIRLDFCTGKIVLFLINRQSDRRTSTSAVFIYSTVCIATVWYWRLYQYQCRFVCTVPFVLLQYDIAVCSLM